MTFLNPFMLFSRAHERDRNNKINMSILISYVVWLLWIELNAKWLTCIDSAVVKLTFYMSWICSIKKLRSH